MTNLQFSWGGSTILTTQLVVPIVRVSVRTAAHGRPIAITLWRPDASGLHIQSTMHDLANRIEVGVLHFTLVESVGAEELVVGLPSSFVNGLKATKLVIAEGGSIAESGVLLEATDGRQIAIVAGASPYTLAISGVFDMPHMFEPEYPLNSYSPVPLL